MPVRCQDCNSHFLLDSTTVTHGIGCPDCGGNRLERDQPSPTHSDGELRDMVNPATQLDQGGNPLQEGIWAGVDGGWQPAYRRDETLSSAPTPQVTGSAPSQQPKQAMSYHDRSLSQEPYLPWYHQADVKRYPGDGGAPISLTNDEWASSKRQSFFERKGFLPALAPLLPIAGRMLLAQGVGALMKKAIGGAGNFLDQGTNLQDQGSRPVGLVASEHTAVGVNMPVETPDSTRDFVEDHDPEAVDQQEFNDRDMSPAFNNPNIDDADAGMARSMGEDATNQKLEFRHDGDAVGQAELVLPLLLEFMNSEKSGLSHPQIKALHEALEAEIPGYLDHADENDESLQKLLDALTKHESKVGVAPRPWQEWRDHPTNIPGIGMRQGEGVIPCPACKGHGCEDCRNTGRVYAPNYRENGDPDSPFKWMTEGFDRGTGMISPERMRQNPELFYDTEGRPIPPDLGPVRQGGTKEGYLGPANMPANQNPQAGWVQQTKMLIDYYRSIGNEAEAQKLEATLAHMPQVNQVAASTHEAAPVYQTTPMNPGQQQMGQGQQMGMPGTYQNPVQPGGMPVSGKCVNCGGVVNADGSCPQCGANAGANQQGLQQGQQQTPPGIMPSPYAHTAADHQGPITPQQQKVFAEYLIQQGRNDEVAPMMANPALYADEWAQYLNRQTQPPEVDPSEQAPQPQMDPSMMGQMPVPGMQAPQQPMASVKRADNIAPRCPNCTSASTSILNEDGDMRCHRCQHIWDGDSDVVKEKTGSWVIKSYQDALGDTPNPVATDAADATAPGDREQQQDSSMTWQDNSGQPLQVGQVYEMHSQVSPIPDVVKIEAVKPDSITVSMQGEFQSPVDPQDPQGQNKPGYMHEIDRNELQTVGLTFNPMGDGSDAEQSQDQADKDGVGQTVNTEPVEQPHSEFPNHASVQKEALGGPITDQDPMGQLHVGQQVNYIAYGGRTEQGFIVGFQAAGPMDPLVKNRVGEERIISRQDIQGDPVQIPEEPMAAAASFQRFAPLSEYDQYFGGKSGAAAEAKAAMVKQYGEKKGEEVFYATINKRKSSFEEAEPAPLPTDYCPKCDYGHVTSSYVTPERVRYECYRCATSWEVDDPDEGSELAPETREWLQEDSSSYDEIGFDPRALAMASAGQGRNIRDIAQRDPRLQQISSRLEENKKARTAGAKFSPREQKEFIDEEGTARNADLLNLDGTHYVSAFDNTKARPERVNDNYLGLGL